MVSDLRFQIIMSIRMLLTAALFASLLCCAHSRALGDAASTATPATVPATLPAAEKGAGKPDGKQPAPPPSPKTAAALGILKQNCFSCHSSEKHKGGLMLTTREGALKGGENGPVLVPGKVEQSPL